MTTSRPSCGPCARGEIYDNIRRFVKYALTTNSAEVWTIFLAPILGFPIPLLPIHILSMDLVTDGLPGLALAAEPEERDVMSGRRGARTKGCSHMASAFMWCGSESSWRAWRSARDVVLRAGLCALADHGVHGAGLLALAHLLAVRSERDSLLSQGLLSNRPLAAAVALTVALQLAVVYLPALNVVFVTEPLTPGELFVAVGVFIPGICRR